MSVNDAYTDVVELCALLQCLGFSVRSLETSEVNLSQDVGTRTVVINCQSSGLHVVLESPGLACSCPATDQQNSGVWQVSGVTGGKHLDKEFGCTLLGSLPKPHRERLTKELREMIRCIKQHNDSDHDKKKELNKSTSIIELNTPEKRLFQSRVDTPTRYRSLDTLTAAKAESDQQLPAPRPLTKRLLASAYGDDNTEKKTMCRRQSTYTLSSTPGSSIRRRNKTSSPIQSIHNPLLETLIEAEKEAEELRNKIAYIRKEFVEEKNDSSMSSLALDVSKISVLKAEPPKAQFASSPNLSGLGTVQEDFPKSRLKRFESASTSHLGPKSLNPNEKPSRLKRISPNIFKMRKDAPPKVDKLKPDSKSSKLNNLFRPKIVTPVHSKLNEASPNSASKKKFSHVKSTIPRPTPVKKD
ncbi:uncharacterized protein LOC114356266 isoform X2 [Ostrinia furnacalis]|uniref:uncharacterized protein LOC114356266 isoform X2 n=1 Tax=Ostrinia furnacalis TaxID=93504 RepID=UPI00103EAF68|nr:uncharacterized protein LOC114356266 isoform X2 [Ostrinia furnacalis]